MYDDDAVMTMKQASNMFDVHFTSQVIHSKMFVLLLNIQTPENHCFFCFVFFGLTLKAFIKLNTIQIFFLQAK